MKINLGSHNKRLEGYTNVDVLDLPNVDVVHDLTLQPYPFADDSVEEILTHEFLEHVSFRVTQKILRECYRILKPSGKMIIQVPDIGKMCEYYVEKLICDCVPRKTNFMHEYKANPKCKMCKGKAKIHPERWHFAFTGAQKHEFDSHLNIFTRGNMKVQLHIAGFTNVRFVDNIYKLVVFATKKDVLKEIINEDAM